MPSVSSVKSLVVELIVDLDNAGQYSYSNNLKKCLLLLEGETEVVRGLEAIQGLCNIRALGDAHMPEFNGYDWPNKVEKLSKRCKKVLRSYEKNT